jgi:hypothetical protein
MLFADTTDGNIKTVLGEIDSWARKCFETEDAFSILGI